MRAAAVEARAQAASSIKDAAPEALASPSCGAWVGPLCAALHPDALPPQFRDSPTNQLRGALLDLVCQVVHNEASRAHVGQLFDACLGVARTDNQEHALVALKLMFDMFKSSKGAMEAQAEPMLELAAQVCACVCARLRACTRMCMCACMRMRVGVCVCVSVRVRVCVCLCLCLCLCVYTGGLRCVCLHAAPAPGCACSAASERVGGSEGGSESGWA